MSPVETKRELRKQLAKVRRTKRIEAKGTDPATIQAALRDEAESIRRVGRKIVDTGSAENALTALKIDPPQPHLAIEEHGWPLVRGTVLELAYRMTRGERIRDIPAWLTAALHGKWAGPAVPAATCGAVPADAVNAPAEIEIEYAPEVRAAMESGRVPECTEQEAAQIGIACAWPHIIRSVWENVIRVSDPTTAAALRSYLAEMDQGTRPAVEK